MARPQTPLPFVSVPDSRIVGNAQDSVIGEHGENKPSRSGVQGSPVRTKAFRPGQAAGQRKNQVMSLRGCTESQERVGLRPPMLTPVDHGVDQRNEVNAKEAGG